MSPPRQQRNIAQQCAMYQTPRHPDNTEILHSNVLRTCGHDCAGHDAVAVGHERDVIRRPRSYLEQLYVICHIYTKHYISTKYLIRWQRLYLEQLCIIYHAWRPRYVSSKIVQTLDGTIVSWNSIGSRDEESALRQRINRGGLQNE